MKNRYARTSDLLYHTYQFFECYLKKQSLQNMKLFLLLVVYKACLEIKCISIQLAKCAKLYVGLECSRKVLHVRLQITN